MRRRICKGQGYDCTELMSWVQHIVDNNIWYDLHNYWHINILLTYWTDNTDLREPRQTQSPSLSPITHGSSSSSSPSSRSPLASSLARSVFHSDLQQILSSADLFLSNTGLIPRTLDHLMFLFCSMAGLVCMVCQTKPALSRFLNAL